MGEVVFGFIGVLVGGSIPLLYTKWTRKRDKRKNAEYLAIRIVCIMDKYLQDCTDVVKDTGLSYGQRSQEGYLRPQVKVPGQPLFPEDVDYKCIDSELMYRILSLPTEIQVGERLIALTEEFAAPPDFDAWFEERRFFYSSFALAALNISNDLCTKYKIKKISYTGWDPAADLLNEHAAACEKRNQRMKSFGAVFTK